MFDRVGRVDPVTRGLEIAIHWVGLTIDFNFWSQHVSFLLVGCIVVTSIRGLLLTLTKVIDAHKNARTYHFLILIFCFSFSTQSQAANRATSLSYFLRR